MEQLNFIMRKVREILWSCKKFQYKVEIIPDNPDPDILIDNIVYVVGRKKYTKWAYLKCPCGCGDIIMLSLDKINYPSWSVRQDKFGKATISPSIDKLEGCRSHFFIKKGKLIWVKGDLWNTN
ncbi:hypothetical protein SDC9_35596 [bioreactor metagenome]|jgi:hypothetical protein|uniref:Uncharacterized protein n=2 Tax=root TaxID=1 RepID=A0A644VE34_9ZZZZ|nr:DUF6527 family protein [Massilibacteroides vaginae]OJX56442.1 MAG: hypothetical protein BGO84_03135 [Dysgonomonas sp. 37-18]OJX90838.1 MAG: hypothetical protein BGP01_05610 [Paludibacter sp. 47-17]PKP37800.1 MAG: hypothetical protein CVT97_04295 [Bacteroidetes bacterium HGW-Bacteroidetes-14]